MDKKQAALRLIHNSVDLDVHCTVDMVKKTSIDQEIEKYQSDGGKFTITGRLKSPRIEIKR